MSDPTTDAERSYMNETDKTVTKEGIRVEVGQVWRDLDKRVRRTVTVEEVDALNGIARVRSSISNTRSKLSIRRMHKHGQGYELVSLNQEPRT